MKTAKQILLEAADLVEKGWTRHVNARDAKGIGVTYKSEEAVCFCSMGAILRASGAFTHRSEAVMALKEVIGEQQSRAYSIVYWNDYVSKSGAEAAAMMRKAAERVS